MLGDFYQKKKGWMHLLDPRTLVLVSFLFFIMMLFLKSICGQLIFFIMLHGLLLSAKMSLKRIYHVWKIIIPVIFMILIFHPLTSFQEGDILFQFKFIRMTSEGFFSSLITALRLPNFIIISYLPMFFHRQNSLIRGLTLLRIPYRVSLLMTLTLRLLPSFKENYDKILQAQQMRGLKVKKMSVKSKIPILVSLIVSSLRNSEDIALALEMRGLGLTLTPTSIIDLKFKKIDVCFMLITFFTLIVKIFIEVKS